jgi:uncharacterized protein (TIGR02270 family)
LLVDAPNAFFDTLGRHDDRLVAHIDGLRLAGDAGYKVCEARLGLGEPGAIFVAMLLALEGNARSAPRTLVAVAEALPDMRTAVEAAFDWASARFLRGTAKRMLEAESPFRRSLAIACCAMHRVDPGPPLKGALADPNPALRERALRCAGALGRRDLLPTCLAALADDEPTCVFTAARSAVLLGDRTQLWHRSDGRAPRPARARAMRFEP